MGVWWEGVRLNFCVCVRVGKEREKGEAKGTWEDVGGGREYSARKETEIWPWKRKRTKTMIYLEIWFINRKGH